MTASPRPARLLLPVLGHQLARPRLGALVPAPLMLPARARPLLVRHVEEEAGVPAGGGGGVGGGHRSKEVE
jgi:hypothetical protein